MLAWLGLAWPAAALSFEEYHIDTSRGIEASCKKAKQPMGLVENHAASGMPRMTTMMMMLTIIILSPSRTYILYKMSKLPLCTMSSSPKKMVSSLSSPKMSTWPSLRLP